LDLAVYHGWRIYAHVGRIAHGRIPELKSRIKDWFNQGEWTIEDNCKTLIHNQTIDSQIEVIFKEETTAEEKSKGLTNYGIVFKSDLLGWRNEHEHRHQQLCDKVFHKITWRKEIYYLMNDKLTRVPKPRRLRWK